MRKRAKVIEIASDEENIQEKSVDKEDFMVNGSENNELPNNSDFKIKKAVHENILQVHEFDRNNEELDAWLYPNTIL